jgi:hypothetical protein
MKLLAKPLPEKQHQGVVGIQKVKNSKLEKPMNISESKGVSREEQERLRKLNSKEKNIESERIAE